MKTTQQPVYVNSKGQVVYAPNLQQPAFNQYVCTNPTKKVRNYQDV